jgi:hypothetical protein
MLVPGMGAKSLEEYLVHLVVWWLSVLLLRSSWYAEWYLPYFYTKYWKSSVDGVNVSLIVTAPTLMQELSVALL